jgi:holliday junction DNA helicase RuvA
MPEIQIKPIFSHIFESMIAYLKGKFVIKSPALLQVDVNGVGYEVNISLHTYTAIKDMDEGLIYTYLHIREDAHLLYGFAETAEKEMFLLLTGVNGIGMATARMMLSSLKPADLSAAIVNGNIKVLESIKGIGRKTAERVVLELKDRLAKQDMQVHAPGQTGKSVASDAVDALVTLGIARNMAENAVQKSVADGNTDVGEMVKRALQHL